MTKGIIALVGVVLMLTACAKENESRASSQSSPLPKPAENEEPINTGGQFDPKDFPNINNSIYGAWKAEAAEFGSDLLYITSLYFNDHDEIGFQRACIGFGEELTVATVVNGEITSNKVKITQSATVSDKGGRIPDCTLSVEPGSFSYNRVRDRLEVTFQPGDTRFFTRSKN